MFLVRGQKAILRQYNRTENNAVFDDQDYNEITIKCCPYDIAQGIRFGIYTVPEATGYYQVPRFVDVKQGDQIIFIGNYQNENEPTFDEQVHTILEVQDNWLFNRVENKILAVK
jgi:hypothetical protein|uniref:Uncharacterized protein n=1 Tax=Siphoviridae sp. ctqwY3 TaxID=2827951 RepID=A0A8S5S6Q2_9CAUD|nr:MAG TPA: hypothetical protein [Siphoviridae sp. ctqwY3]